MPLPWGWASEGPASTHSFLPTSRGLAGGDTACDSPQRCPWGGLGTRRVMEPAGCTHGCHTGDLGAPMTASRVSPRLGCTTGCPQSCCVPMPRVSLYQTRPWCPPTPGPAPMGDLGVPEGGRKGRRHPAPRHLRGCRKSWVLSAPTSLGHSSPATASTQLIAPAAVMTGDPWWHWVAYGGSGCPVVVPHVP